MSQSDEIGKQAEAFQAIGRETVEAFERSTAALRRFVEAVQANPPQMAAFDRRYLSRQVCLCTSENGAEGCPLHI